MVMIFLIVLLIAGAAYFTDAFSWQGSKVPAGAATSAREVLDLRYARGEIDTQEYERIKRDIV